MRLLESYQYQGTKSYRNITLMTYNYWDNSNRKDFYFNDPSAWGVTATSLPATPTLIPLANLGTQVYNGVSDSNVNPIGIFSFNPLTIQARKATKSFYITTAGQGRIRLVNSDFKDNQFGSFKAISDKDGAKLALFYYTDNTLAKAYKVVLDLPLKDTIYTFNYDIFATSGSSFGTPGTAVNFGGQLYNSGTAVVSQVGSPSGTVVYALGVFGDTVPASTKVTPIYLENNNSSLTHVGSQLFNETCCPEEVAIELEREYNELKCKGDTSSKTIKSQSMKVTLKLRKNVELMQAMGLSNDLIQTTVTRIGASQELQVTSGASIETPLGGSVTTSNILYITIDDGARCVTLQRDYINNTSASLDPNKFYVDITNNKVIFSTAIAGVTTVTAWGWTKDLARVVDYYTKNNPFRAILDMSRNNSTGTQISGDLIVLELGYGKYSAEDEGDTWEYECTAILTDYNKAIHYTI